jgi:hypothetical protein
MYDEALQDFDQASRIDPGLKSKYKTFIKQAKEGKKRIR